jgi:hypothetical protein
MATTTRAAAAMATTPRAAAAMATTAAVAAAASGELDARLWRIFLVEDVECAQANVGDFFLAESYFVTRSEVQTRERGFR